MRVSEGTVQITAQPEAKTNNRREQIGWYFYAWAYHGFWTCVISVFLGPYLASVAKAGADAAGYVHPLGIPVYSDSFFPYVVSLSVLLQLFLLPVLGAIADRTSRKKELMGLFAYVGAFATMGLFFVTGSDYLLGGLLFLVANMAYGSSVIIYNSYLPEIASPERRTHVSSIGWGLGYLGGGLLLALNLVLVMQADALGISQDTAVRICLASAGVWWAIFTIVPLLTIRRRRQQHPAGSGTKRESPVRAGFSQLYHTLRSMRRYPQTLLFLAAYLLYNDGVQTVIVVASLFGANALGMSVSALAMMILMVQFVAFFGNLIFIYADRIMGTKRAIIISLVIWMGTLIYAYALLKTQTEFFLLGVVIAIVLGGSQALSRSLYSHLIPKGKEAEYYSFYEISSDGTSWFGPFLFGLALQLTGSYQISILSLIVLFISGLALLLFVNVRKGVADVGNVAPEKI